MSRPVAPELARTVVRDARGVLTASDPGLLRLRLGLRAVVGVLLVVGAEAVVAPAVGIPAVVATLFGGMVAMNGSFAASSLPPRDAALTLAAFPLVALAGMVPAALLAGHPAAGRAVFVVVMVAAVYVRRFGPRWFNYGMFAWLAYFFTVFVGFRPAQLGALLAVVACATACMVVSAALLVPGRPDRLLAGALDAYRLRMDALLASAGALLDGRLAPERARQVLHGRAVRLVEAALIVDGHLALALTDDRRAAGVRHDLLESDLAAEELAVAATAVAAAGDVPATARTALLTAIGAARRRDPDDVRDASDAVRAAVEDPDARPSDATAGTLVGAVDALGRLMAAVRHGADTLDGDVPPHVTEYSPAVPLFLGNLPGTAASATSAVQAGGSRWAQRSLNTRLCLQVALAGALTVAAGHALSAHRYYWAVLAGFLTMTGTFTTGETLVKGVSRVVGTLGGLLAAALAVHLTGHDDVAVIGVMVLCIFLGLYLFRVSYVVMAFAVTTVMGELYNVLREYSERLLLLRLEETALGVVIAVVVVLVVLPVRTQDALDAARHALLDAVDGLLLDVSERLSRPERRSDLFFDARRVDAAVHQLALVARPSGGATLLGVSGRRSERDLSPWMAVASRARALAAAVAELEPGEDPELAAQVDALRARLAQQPAAAAAVVESPDRVARLVRDLASALEPLVDTQHDDLVAAR